VDGDALLVALPDLAVSTGSACNSHGGGGSHVLEAIGIPAELVQSATRFGLGRFTTEEEVDYAGGRVVEAVRQLREENRKLKGLVADLSLDKHILQEVLSKKV